jgi:Serine aminopeptidase, S33
VFDKRGTGLSDQLRGVPTLEERIDDIRAVMDAAGSERAVVYGDSDGAAMSALFAATYPDRTAGAILYGGAAREGWAPDYPWGSRPERVARAVESIVRKWGTLEFAQQDLRAFAPSVAGDLEIERLWASWIRFSARPAAFAALVEMNMENDIRHVLPAIRVPTLVLALASGPRRVGLALANAAVFVMRFRGTGALRRRSEWRRPGRAVRSATDPATGLPRGVLVARGSDRVPMFHLLRRRAP